MIVCNYKQASMEAREMSDWTLGTLGVSWEHSIVTRGGRRIGWGEWNTFTRFLRCAVVHSLLTRNSNGEDRKCGKDRVPVLLAEVVRDVVHVSSSPWPPELRVELVSGFDEVTSCVRLVCAFNLIWVSAGQ